METLTHQRSVSTVAAARIVAAIAATLTIVAAARHVALGDSGAPYLPEPREWVLAGLATLLGVRIIPYVPRNPIGWMFVALGSTAAVTLLTATFPGPDLVTWIRVVTWWPVYALLIVIALTFPAGRAPTALLATTVATAATAAIALALVAWDDPAGFLTPPAPHTAPAPLLIVMFAAATITVVVGGAGAAAVLTVRGLRARGRPRRLYAWAAVAVGLLVVADVLDVLGMPAVWVAEALAFPAAAVLAVVRYGLYDIDLLVHRTLLYGSLTAVLLAAYAGVVAALAGLVPTAAAPAAAAVVVVAVAPVRQLLQRRVDRFVYGERRSRHEVMDRLGARLEQTPDPAQVLTTIVDTVVEALRVPRATLKLVGESSAAAERGRTRGRPVFPVPVAYQGEEVGQLLVEQRSPEERFTRPERELLASLARQAGAVVRAVALARDLQLSRERLVIAREEERRRLRRDLHDGIGPALVGMRMQLMALRRDAANGTPAATAVDALTEDLARSVAELHTLVDGLRPPALDQGLVAALLDETERFRGPAGPTVTVVSSGSMGNLPAAVEVATFRMVVEAITNAVRHGRARACTVRLSRQAGSLDLEVTDDGDGLPRTMREGVGTRSMRERAAELGGECRIEPAGPDGGCRVWARLPLTRT